MALSRRFVANALQDARRRQYVLHRQACASDVAEGLGGNASNSHKSREHSELWAKCRFVAFVDRALANDKNFAMM